MTMTNNASYRQLILGLTSRVAHGRTGLRELRKAMQPNKTGFSQEECNDIRKLIDALLNNLLLDNVIKTRHLIRKIKMELDWKTIKCNSATKIIEAYASEESPYKKFVVTYTRKKNANPDKEWNGDKTVYGFEESCKLTIHNKDGSSKDYGPSGVHHNDLFGYVCNEQMHRYKLIAMFKEGHAQGYITAKEAEHIYHGMHGHEYLV